MKLFSELNVPLAQIFKVLLCQHCVPKSWKLANVIPIYKGKGSKLDIENYRPISLTNIYYKIIETLLCNKINKYLDANKLLSYYQYGFRSSRSTLSQLLLVNAKFIECTNNRAYIDVVYTAFDSILQKKLVMEVKAYGINYYVCQWIAHFLSNRSQRVVVMHVQPVKLH